ncbi:MAG: acyl-CoA dehydrogenase family protein, partial [Streptosporangiaceae bacterium]
MDFAEPEEHRALRAAVADIAAKFGPRYYAERAGARRPCAELWQALGDAGFIGVNIPEEYGGGGGGLTELALVCEEIAAAGTPLLLLLVSAAISAEMISEFGTGEQRGTWLPGLASGAAKMVFAITEPDAGSNTLRISTTARKDGEDWVLHGTKYYISGVDEADALLVVARTGPAASASSPGQARNGAPLSLFIVPADSPGLERSVLPVDLLLP